jgi:hypothetical protein
VTRLAGVAALLALYVAYAWPMQVNGYNQNAHYALVRALAVHHTPNIDKSRGEIGQLSTGDEGYYHGHYYAAKAPGLAIVSLPAFGVVEGLGMRTTGDPTRVIWALHLWSIALAALGLVVLVRYVGDGFQPGLGTAAAVTFGLGTLILPFATLFFSHVPSAALGFAAFAVLWRERQRAPSLWLVAAAGAFAGLAVSFEYPLVFAGALVGLYAIARPSVVRRAAAYAGGVVVGLIPLLAFNLWAFHSLTHIAYQDYYGSGNESFGFHTPSLHAASDLLFSSMGLLTLTPVVAAGVAGAVVLFRRHRAEALLSLAIPALYLLWNSSLTDFSPFGGLGPPRYLIAMLPFLGPPLAVAYRAFPLSTLALGAVSAFQMTVMTATGALASYDGEWLSRARHREFAQTGASIVDVTGWYTIALFFLAVLVAVAAGAVATGRLAVSWRELPIAVAAVAAWAVIALRATNPAGLPPSNGYVVATAVVLVAGCALLALAGGGRPRPLSLARRQSA